MIFVLLIKGRNSLLPGLRARAIGSSFYLKIFSELQNKIKKRVKSKVTLIIVDFYCIKSANEHADSENPFGRLLSQNVHMQPYQPI